MINYRVENLEAFVKISKEESVIFTDEIESFDHRNFIHLLFVEGNKIEPREPNDIEFDKIIVDRTNYFF
jgi:hypothetical protein